MKGLDLNLLRLLVALEQTRHLGRAAEKLEMSQSGFSTALSRLRTQLRDELFVRSSGGMRPTPRAMALAETARAVLQQVEEGVLGTAVFDPARSEFCFRLAMSDVGEAVFVPTLVQHLSTTAPDVSLRIISTATGSLHERLADGEVDLAVGYFPDLDRDAYFRQPLLDHTYACLLRKAHPVLASGLSRSAYSALGHAVIANPSRSTSLLEVAIEREHLKRRVVLASPNHLSLPATIARTDLVATVLLGTAVDAARRGDVVVVALPFKPPTFPVYQYWHRRTHREPGHQWLRGELKKLFSVESDPYAEQRRALYGRTGVGRKSSQADR